MFDHNRKAHYYSPPGIEFDGSFKGCGEKAFAPVTREEFDALEARIAKIEERLKAEDDAKATAMQLVEENVVKLDGSVFTCEAGGATHQQNMADLIALRSRGIVTA